MAFKLYSITLRRVLNRWPGKRYLGEYRFLPLFFVLGASLEYSMINWKVGNISFCAYQYDFFPTRPYD